jgi:hypothetical protein
MVCVNPPLDAQQRDPNYVPSESPRSRHELRYTREQPPITRFRTRLQALQDRPGQETHDHADTVQCTVLNEINNVGRKAYTKKHIVLPRVDKDRREGPRRKVFPLP